MPPIRIELNAVKYNREFPLIKEVLTFCLLLKKITYITELRGL